MTKQLVLEYFEKYKGEIISGAELAEHLGVTRAAIWKVINNLREEGYDIESIKKKGYRLNINSDILSTIKIQNGLKKDKYDLRVYKVIESTNKTAKIAAVMEEREWIVVAAEEQEKGKGRGKKHFPSPNGKGVYVSIVLRPNVEIEKKVELIRLSGEAVKEVIRKLAGIEIEIKTPNDMMYQGKKIGGILSEVIMELETEKIEVLIIGIGINIYGTREDFSNQNDDITISLSEIMGRYCNRSEVITGILNQLEEKYTLFKEALGTSNHVELYKI